LGVESSHSSSRSVVTETVVAFLKDVPPFRFLPTAELTRLASQMALELFTKDTVILGTAYSAADTLYVVYKGGVRLTPRSQAGKQLVRDMRSEGEIFGLLSLMGRDHTRLDVTSIEDTLCYTIPGKEVQRLISSHVEVANYLLRTSVTRYVDRTGQVLQPPGSRRPSCSRRRIPHGALVASDDAQGAGARHSQSGRVAANCGG
jgi:CBS domain-containing protein